MKNDLLVRLHVEIMDVFVSWSSIIFTSSPQQEEECTINNFQREVGGRLKPNPQLHLPSPDRDVQNKHENSF